MQIQRISANILRVPLRKPFRHASAVRNHSDNIVVRVELANGTQGWGEGVPREYVTGETADTALAQFASTPLGEQLEGDALDWTQVLELCQQIAPVLDAEDDRDCKSNSLRCAIELAVLDAFGKCFGESLSTALQYFGPASKLLSPRNQVFYSTTIDAEKSHKLWRSALKMRVYGFCQCKVKVGADNEADVRRVGIVRRWIGSKVDLRADANEAWRPEQLVGFTNSLSALGITCIEQPLPHEELAALGELRPQLSTPVMLDESLTSMVDARRAASLGACDLLNIRLSKCGGLLRSIELAAFANDQSLAYQLGCHPGETSILSAAGRHFATTIGGSRYLEGSYDRHVLAKRLATDDMTFSYGGRAPALSEPGLGTNLDLELCGDCLKENWVTQEF